MLTFNAHVHLNGSISHEYLETTATRNNCLELYHLFKSEPDLWKKFTYIHQIMKTTEDVKLATIDVVKHSTADIIEIRTTPKRMGNREVTDYIHAFVGGLLDAKRLFPEKQARGILSIDRSRHTLQDAKWIIDAALKEKQSSGMIVGVDLSGNFEGNRTLTGKDLYEAISYALRQDIGVALHVGEANSDIERNDFNILLKAIEDYHQENPASLYGKVRLGHAIYRTAEQDERIKALKIPIEICPSCHEKLSWWKKDEPHPILTLYKHLTKVIPGTDDNILFDCHDKGEQQKLHSFLIMPDKYHGLSEADQQAVLATKRKRYMFSSN